MILAILGPGQEGKMGDWEVTREDHCGEEGVRAGVGAGFDTVIP